MTDPAILEVIMKINPTDKFRFLRAKEKLTALVYPRVCPVCNKIIRQKDIDRAAEEGFRGHFENPFICKDCYLKLEFTTDLPVCMKCGRPTEDEREEYCRDCRNKQRDFNRGIALALHNESARKIIYDLKYAGMRDNADALAYEAAYLFAREIAGMEIDAIIPVPLHRNRMRERMYNQAELIAKRLAFFLELYADIRIPVDADHLIRAEDTPRLSALSGGERAKSLAGAFDIKRGGQKYERVLLVDDIFTTGSTLNECAKTLRRFGTHMIYFLTMTIGS